MTEQPQTPQTKSGRKGIITVIVVFGGMFLMFFLFAFIAIASMSDGAFSFAAGERVGIVEVEGPIMGSKKIVKNLRRYARDESIKGIVVRVNSPGGAVAPSQEIFRAIEDAGTKKPIAVSMGSTAASGGYYVALGADRIFANPGTVTGSIGVITQLFDVHEILNTVNVEVNTIKTGPYKDSGSPFREFNLQDEVQFRQLIDDVYDQFVDDIAAARNMDVEAVKKLADGRVFTGRQAKELALVDDLGTFQDAVDWVAKKADVKGEPKIVYPPKDGGLLDEIIRGGVQSLVSETRASTTPLVEYRYVGPQ